MDGANVTIARDIVSATQLTLPDVFVSVFRERIQPELILILREIADAQQQQRSTEVNFSHELYSDLLSQIEDLKRCCNEFERCSGATREIPPLQWSHSHPCPADHSWFVKFRFLNRVWVRPYRTHKRGDDEGCSPRYRYRH